MGAYRVYVYAIAKNESKFVDRWLASMKEADEVFVLDTGSDDETVKLLKAGGANVKSEIITPWRFDTARNRSLELVPEDADICVCTDLDEVFESGWREKVEAAWSQGAEQLRYRYTWSFGADGREGSVFYIDKIHSPKGFRWVNAVHEVLEYTLDGAPRSVLAEGVQLNHHPDGTKSRAQYLELLELSVQEDPNNCRNVHYLGREYMFYRRWRECIMTLNRYLKMPNAVWRDERAASYRFIARAYNALGNREQALSNLLMAAAEAPQLREPWLELAAQAYSDGDFEGVAYFSKRALSITERTKTYITEPDAWGARPYDYASLGYFYTGRPDKALEMVDAALKLDPADERLIKNRKLIEGSIRAANNRNGSNAESEKA